MSDPKVDPKRLYQAVLNGDADAAIAVTEEALAAGMDPQALVTEQSRRDVRTRETGRRGGTSPPWTGTW